MNFEHEILFFYIGRDTLPLERKYVGMIVLAKRS